MKESEVALPQQEELKTKERLQESMQTPESTPSVKGTLHQCRGGREAFRELHVSQVGCGAEPIATLSARHFLDLSCLFPGVPLPTALTSVCPDARRREEKG